MRIRWTPAAAADLRNISNYHTQHHPHYRQPTMRKLYDTSRYGRPSHAGVGSSSKRTLGRELRLGHWCRSLQDMPSAKVKFRRPACVVVTCLIWDGLALLRATEKRWIAHQAQAIVVGALNATWTYPWFDGWHADAVITVDEVLYGGTLPRQMNLRAACKWENRCQAWPPPRYSEFLSEKGIWFLRRVDQNNWESANGFSDTGFRPLSSRAYWENYIRLYKK
jgi:plasmid stabilization system protein ParE